MSHRSQWLWKSTVDGVEGPSEWVASKLDWTTSNWITAMRIIALPVVAAIFAYDAPLWLIFAVMTPHFLMDWFDGALARRQQRLRGAELDPREEADMSLLERLNWRGVTSLGKVLDPLADKGTYNCCLIPGGWDYLPRSMIVMSLVLAILLTFSRPILKWKFRAEVASNWFGKRKVWLEVLTIAGIAVLPHTGWFATTTIGFLALANIFAMMSLVLQVWRATASDSSV